MTQPQQADPNARSSSNHQPQGNDRGGQSNGGIPSGNGGNSGNNGNGGDNGNNNNGNHWNPGTWLGPPGPPSSPPPSQHDGPPTPPPTPGPRFGNDDPEEDGDRRRDRIRTRESDEIERLQLPQGTQWVSRRNNSIHAIVSAAGRPDDLAMEWIMKVETHEPSDLEERCYGWVSLDHELAAAVTKIFGGELGRVLTQAITVAPNLGRAARGELCLQSYPVTTQRSTQPS